MDNFLDCVIHLMGATAKAGLAGAQNAADVMRTLNADYLGGGNFSSVFAMPWGNDRRVIKITGSNRDDGAMVVCRTAMRLKAEGVVDPLMPDIFAMHEFSKGYFMVEMERLESTHGSNRYTQMFNGDAERVPKREAVTKSPYLTALAKDMAAYVDEPGNKNVNLAWDLHGENIMLRRGKPVITDPIAYFRLSPSDRHSDTGRKQRIEMGFPAKRDNVEQDRIVMPDFMQPVLKPDVANLVEMGMDSMRRMIELHRPDFAMREFMAKPIRMVDHVKPPRHHDFIPFMGLKPRVVLDELCMDEGRKLPKGANDRPVNKHDAKPPRAHDHLLNQNDRRIANGEAR